MINNAKELHNAKREAEEKIAGILREFEAKSGWKVSDVATGRGLVSGKWIITLRVELSL